MQMIFEEKFITPHLIWGIEKKINKYDFLVISPNHL